MASRRGGLAQPLELGLDGLDAAIALGEGGGDVGGFEALRNVLQPVRVLSENRKEDRLLGPLTARRRPDIGFLARQIICASFGWHFLVRSALLP
jgi:hypothetical protein